MNFIMAIALQEIRMGLKSTGYWILVVLLNALLLYSLYEDQSFALRATQFFYMFFVFWHLGMLSRDWRNGAAEILNTLPCKDWQLLVARSIGSFWLLIFLGIQLFLMATFVVRFIFPVPIPFGDLLWSYGLNYFLISINSIGITLFIETICFSNRFVATIVASIYVICTFDGDLNTLLPYWLPPTNLAVNLAATEFPSQLTGSFPKHEFVPMVLCQQLGLSALLFLISYYFYSKRRSAGTMGRTYGLLVIVALVACLVGSCLLVKEYQGREQSYQGAFRNQLVDARQGEEQEKRVVPLSYVMNVKVTTALHVVDCNTKILLQNTSDSAVQELVVTLKNYYSMQKVTESSGQELVWERTGDFVRIQLSTPLVAGGTMELELDYGGEVREWFTDYDAQPRGFINFVSPEMVLLRSGHAWYPTLGKTLLYDIIEYPGKWSGKAGQVLSARNVSHRPVNFSLTVEVDQDMEVVTGLPLREEATLTTSRGKKFTFFSPASQEVFLVAAPYVKKLDSTGNIRGYCAQLHAENAIFILELVRQQTEFYKKLIPVPDREVVKVLEVPAFLINSWMGETAERKRLGLKNVILVSEYYFKSLPQGDTSEKKLQRIYFEEAVLSLWWPGFTTTDPGNISAGMLSYMHTLYKENQLGKGHYDEVKQFWTQYEPETNLAAGAGLDRERSHAGGHNLVVKEVFLLLDEIRQSELGDEGVRFLLQKVYGASLTNWERELEWRDVLQAMDELAEEFLQKGYSREQVNAILTEPREKAKAMNSLPKATVEEMRLFKIR